MRPHSTPQAPPPAQEATQRRMVRSDRNSITCQLDVRTDWSYELCVVPHSDPAAAVIERFDTPTPALLRHSEVASKLRQGGWMVIGDGAALGIHAAA